MSDYKELIADLTAAANRNSNSLNTRDTCRKAADAIEQLVRERDAAVNEVKSMCFCCSKFYDCMSIADNVHIDCKYWEWRGVQNE